jgi:glycosyltransferase involved in cell wall biosynthesis
LKHIVFTVTNDLTHDQRMQRICNSLHNAGYMVTLVGRTLSDSVPVSGNSFNQVRLNCKFHNGPLFYIEFQVRLFIWLCSHRFHIISAVDDDTLLPCTLISIIRQIPLVYDAHEYFTEVPEVHNRYVVKNVWQHLENTCVPHASLCYTVSHSLAQIFSAIHRTPFHVLYNVPVSATLQSTEMLAEPIRLVYQGDLNPGRGIETAIHAIAQLNAELIVVGDGPLRSELERLVVLKRVQHKVIFLGYLPFDEMQRVTASSHLGLNLLSAEGLSYYYSLSNKFFNYIHAGIPQLCADFPEYRKIAKQYEVGMLIRNAEDELVRAVEHIINEPLYYRHLKKQCEVAKAEYNWEKSSSQLIGWYSHV